jgi:hypothetical protein
VLNVAVGGGDIPVSYSGVPDLNPGPRSAILIENFRDFLL